jgi:hypothetical protein
MPWPLLGWSNWEKRLRVALAVVLGLPALLVVWRIVSDSGHSIPHDYEPSSYPLRTVITTCLLVIGEALVLWVVLAAGKSRTLCWRALMCFCVAASLSLPSFGALDRPPYEAGHAAWLVFACLVLALVFVLSGAARLVLFGRSLWRRAP